MTTALSLEAIPFPLTPSEGSEWQVSDGGGTLSAQALPLSDIFIAPGGDERTDTEPLMNAITCMGEVAPGDFQLSARVSVEFASMFDAGVLLLWFDREHWAKLCFEYSPEREATVVSVVNRGVSDDANGIAIDGHTVWLRVSRIGRAFAYHVSKDGERWLLVRVFVLEAPGGQPLVGFEAQSPTGDGCLVTFDDIRFTTETLADLRSGV